MKKVSTAVTKQGRKVSRPKLTIGLDLGDRNSWYCVLEEGGQIQLEQRVRTSAKGLQEVFGAMPRSRIARRTIAWMRRLWHGWPGSILSCYVRCSIAAGRRKPI